MSRVTLASLTLIAAAWAVAPSPASACGTECSSKTGAVTAQANPEAIPVATRATATLAVSGMSCAGCSKKVTAALLGLDGVGEATVDHAAGRAVVTYDSAKVKTDALIKAIGDLGYQATVDAKKS